MPDMLSAGISGEFSNNRMAWSGENLLSSPTQRGGDEMETILIIVVLLLLFGGGGGYWWSRRGR